MLYTLDFPPEVEQSYYKDKRKFNDELPERVKNKPTLKPGLALYFNAWFELDGERDRSTYERIKRSTVFEYAYDYGLTWTQTLDLWFYVRKMDSEFLQWYRKKYPPPKAPKSLRTKRNG